jgi:hypothetical protein
MLLVLEVKRCVGAKIKWRHSDASKSDVLVKTFYTPW